MTSRIRQSFSWSFATKHIRVFQSLFEIYDPLVKVNNLLVFTLLNWPSFNLSSLCTACARNCDPCKFVRPYLHALLQGPQSLTHFVAPGISHSLLVTKSVRTYLHARLQGPQSLAHFVAPGLSHSLLITKSVRTPDFVSNLRYLWDY